MRAAGRPRRGATLTLIVLAVLLVLTATSTAPDGASLRLAAAPGDPTAPLVLGTVPPVAGFPVMLDGVTVMTDAAGKATFPAAPVSDEPLTDRVALTEATLPIGGQQVHVRADRVYPSSREPVLAVDLSYLLSFDFLGIEGAPLPPSSIEAFTVKSETGEIVDIRPGEDAWLHGSRVIKRTAALEIKNLRWSVQRVEFAGSNVVNASQQFFYPAEQQHLDVQLLFFGLDVQVHDAMFGYPQGGAIDLVYPDGKTRRFAVDDGGRLSVPDLPRGDYILTIIGPGPPMSRPLAVSRDQSVELAFYSWLDVLVVLGAVLGAAGALAGAGRIRRRRDIADHPPQRPRRRRLSRQGTDWEGEKASGPATDDDVVHADGPQGGRA